MDEQQQQNQNIAAMNMGGPMFTLSDDFSKWRLNIDSSIEEITHILRGELWVESYDKETGQVIGEWRKRENSVPICNEEGISFIVGKLRLFLGKNTFLSDLDDERINTLAKEFHRTLNNHIFLKYRDWSLDRKYFYISRELSMVVWIGLHRAREGGERKSLTSAERVVRTYDSGRPSKGFGFSLNPFKKPEGP